MKNNLKFQLDRMFRLMENKTPSDKTVISEQALPKLIETLEYLGKSEDDVANAIRIGGIKEADRVIDSFSSLLDRGLSELNLGERQFVSAVIRRFMPEAMTKFENELQRIIQSNRVTPKGFFETVKVQLKSGVMSPQKFVDYIKKYYRKDINLDAVELFVDKIKGKPTEIINLPETWADRIYWSIVNILDNVSKIPSEFWNAFWSELMHTRIPTLVSKLRNGLKTKYNTGYEEHLKPLEEEMENQMRLILKKIEVGGNRDFTDEITVINNKLQEYRMQRVKAAKTLFDEFLVKLKEEKSFKIFFNPKHPNYYKNWWSKNGETTFLVRLLDGYEKAEKTLPKIEITVSKMEAFKTLLASLNPLNKKVSFNGKEFISRVANIFFFYSPRSYDEAMINLNILGFRKWLIRGIAQKIVFSVFVLGFYYSVCRAIFDYLLKQTNVQRIKKGERPYEWIDEITQEDLNEIKSYGSDIAVFRLWINLWKKSVRFITGDLDEAHFWSLGAYYCPKLFGIVNELLKPQPNILPVIKTVKQGDIENEVKKIANESNDSLNSDPKLKEYVTDTLKLTVPTGDEIIQKSESLISNKIK
jgi:hypothetical protein